MDYAVRGARHIAWLRHQHRDAYWRHGSICEDFSKVQTPVMAVSGWADGYSNAVFRLLKNLPGPRLGIIGPWSHRYPHLGVPGPAIGFLQECLRWWDKWLKDKDTGIMNEPVLRAWMLESMPPSTSYRQRYGHWVGVENWPPLESEMCNYKLAQYRLVDENKKVPHRTLSLQSPLSNGMFAGKWCSYSYTPDLPHDQREEDGGALVFTSEPLEEPLKILGAPELELEISSDRPVAMIAVRLSDMQPDNKCTRVTYGVLNLTHRNSHAHPSALEPHKTYRVRIQLNDVAQIFPKGNSIRIAISSSYFPLAWPAPQSTRLKIHMGKSRLKLPLCIPCEADIKFPPVEMATKGKQTTLSEGEHNWRVIRDLARDISTLEVIHDQGTSHLEDIDLTVQRKTKEWYSFQGDDFNSTRGETHWTRSFKRGDWHVKTITRTLLQCDSNYFYLSAELDAYEGDRRIYSNNWHHKIKRVLV